MLPTNSESKQNPPNCKYDRIQLTFAQTTREYSGTIERLRKVYSKEYNLYYRSYVNIQGPTFDKKLTSTIDQDVKIPQIKGYRKTNTQFDHRCVWCNVSKIYKIFSIPIGIPIGCTDKTCMNFIPKLHLAISENDIYELPDMLDSFK